MGRPNATVSTAEATAKPTPPCTWSSCAECEPPEAQAFWRAAERNRVAGRLFEADRRLEGYAWYDAIARVAAIHIEVMTGYIPTALVALSLIDAERLCDRLNAKLGFSREGWTALAAKSMRAEAREPHDTTRH